MCLVSSHSLIAFCSVCTIDLLEVPIAGRSIVCQRKWTLRCRANDAITMVMRPSQQQQQQFRNQQAISFQ